MSRPPQLEQMICSFILRRPSIPAAFAGATCFFSYYALHIQSEASAAQLQAQNGRWHLKTYAEQMSQHAGTTWSLTSYSFMCCLLASRDYLKVRHTSISSDITLCAFQYRHLQLEKMAKFFLLTPPPFRLISLGTLGASLGATQMSKGGLCLLQPKMPVAMGPDWGRP